ncbi:hypothetical protein [Nocardia coubleae]|uniref:DUF4351 domain-containing protein n=1 Tax=Nocardia coubleae TaxID=356147 RepID=A0A846WAX1_9NOCA|nr:hypothetical protein [Nocardia coubleae]NKX90592.1 hypothetical protein [Nocardia coubleae]
MNFSAEVCPFEEADEYRAEGHAQGRIIQAAQNVLTVLTSRRLELSAQQREQLAACTDLDQLEAWLLQAVTATSADELFG